MKSKRPAKPTVFLSYSSTNRRELLSLKRMLDERAGGLIEFFLSSDDDSIIHGTIWPAEVRAALDRMSLMLVFVSSEALKSGWTYFEAGYGLHRLGTAKIYCLPGTDKGALPSPFNLLQNRNLHTARELSLLIQQVNEAWGAKLDDSLGKQEFERLFKKPSVGQVQVGPAFDEIVSEITVTAFGPSNSAELFSQVCNDLNLTCASVKSEPWQPQSEHRFYSSGLKIYITPPDVDEQEAEFKIDDSIRSSGFGDVGIGYEGQWIRADSERGYSRLEERRSLVEIEAHNLEVRTRNAETKRLNRERELGPRECVFTLSPINVSVPIGILDSWLQRVNSGHPEQVVLDLVDQVMREERVEAIGAKVHGSDLSLRSDGSLLWAEHVIVVLNPNLHSLRGLRKEPVVLTVLDNAGASLGDFQISELVSTMLDLGLLWLPNQRDSKRKR